MGRGFLTGAIRSPDDLREIDEIFPLGEVAGSRYPEEGMALLNG